MACGVRTFTCVDQVLQRVLGIVDAAAGEANREQRRIVVDHIHEAEWGEIRRPCLCQRREEGRRTNGQDNTILANGAQKPNRPWHNGRNQQLVVERCRPPLCIRVNLDVLLLKTGTAVVAPITELPVRIDDLGVGPSRALRLPCRPGGLHAFEVRVGVAFDGGFQSCALGEDVFLCHVGVFVLTLDCRDAAAC